MVLFGSSSYGETLILATDEWPPYEYDHGKKGIAVDLIKAISETEKIPVNIKVYSWARGVNLVKTRQICGIFLIQQNTERKKYMYFMDEPLVLGNDVLFYRKERNYKNRKNLKGLKIGVVIGYIYPSGFWKDVSQSEIDNTASDTYQLLKKVLAGRVDMVIVDKRVGSYILKRMGRFNEISYIPKGYNREYSIAFSKKPENKVIIKKFQNGLKKIKQNGKYQKILNKYP